MSRRTLCALALITGLMGAASPATGYVRTLTSRGNPLSWHETCVFLVPPMYPPFGLTQVDVLAAFQAAADAWTQVAGSYLRFELEPVAAGKVAEYLPSGKNENVLVLLESGWPHDADAAALTTLTYLASSNPATDGRLVDTDVEVNMEGFSFTTSGARDAHDLQNVMTHELGHVIGLDHTCDDGLVIPTPRDHLGNTIPACMTEAQINQLPPAVTEATMFNYAAPEEIDKRTLEADDEAGIAAIYPLAQDPGVCAPPDLHLDEECHCGSGGGPLHTLPCLLAFGWLLLVRSRRRSR